MSRPSRPAGPLSFARWLPTLERLESREVPAISLSQSVSWSELGPNVISGGQTRGITATGPNGGNITNPVIGAVSALAAHPTDASIMYAGGVNGGVWRTINANVAAPAQPAWTPLSDQLASLSVSDISLDPDNPDRMLVGIGGVADVPGIGTFGAEVPGSFIQQSGNLGNNPNELVRGDLVGVYYTTNASAAQPTWTLLTNNLVGKSVTNVALRSGYMLVTTDQGVFRSSDNGATFTNVLFGSTNGGVSFTARTFAEGVFDLADNPRLRDQFYLATRGGAGAVNGAPQVWRTDTGGARWSLVTDAKMQLSANTVNVQVSVRDAGAFDNQVYVAATNTDPTGNQQSTPGIGLQFAWEARDGVVSSVCWSTNQGGDWTRMDGARDLTDSLPATATNDTGTGVVTVSTGLTPHRLQSGDKVRLSDTMRQELTAGDPTTTPPTPPTFGPDIGPALGGLYYLVDVTSATTFVLRDVAITGGLGTFESGEWQRVVGANPGDNPQFFQLLASQTNQNLVYLGGDGSQFSFFNTGGPTSFTGTYWVGDRSVVPTGLGASEGNSLQWDTLTDQGTNSGAGTRTAPGADARDMVFDASGNLWVATGTGVYRRSNLTGSGNWVVRNGNLSLTQFWSVAYDPVSDVVIGSTQDTGAVEQNTTNSLGFRSLNNTAYRNGLRDQEYAYATVVDDASFNTGPTPYSVRYTATGDFNNVRRREVLSDGSVAPGGDSFLNFANQLTTSTPRSGIAPADLLLSDDPSTRIVLELNANNKRRGVYGLTNVYEDSDPQGVTGFIVNNVTPPGMTGRVASMSYGGRRIDPTFNPTVPRDFNQILFVGTTTGQLWVRGEFGPTFNQSAPLADGSPVTDIELDHDDWRHAFVAQGGRVFETTDGGQNWSPISANLVGALDPATGMPVAGTLTSQITSLAIYDPTPNVPNVGGTAGAATDTVLLAGGRGGVFRLKQNACGTASVWAKYGAELPNTVVQDLDVVGDTLVAGTFGRGVWAIANVRPTLTSPTTLSITGDANANVITIQSDPTDSSAILVNDGTGGPTQRFSLGQIDSISITTVANADGSGDQVHIDSNGPTVAGGTAGFLNVPTLVTFSGNSNDLLSVTSSGATAATRATITDTAVGLNPTATAGFPNGDNLFSGCGYVSYAGLQNGVLSVLTGSGADRYIVDADTLPRATFLDGGAGDDTYVFRANTTGRVAITDVAAPPRQNTVLVNGQAYAQTFRTDGSSVTVDNLAVFFDPASIAVTQLRSGNPNGQLVMTGTAGQDLLDVRPTAPAVTPNSTDVVDRNLARPTVRFDGMREVTINTLAAADAVYIGSNAPAAGDTQFVNYVLNVNLGGDADDQLATLAQADTAARTVTVTGTSVGANAGDNYFGTNGYLTYAGLNAGTLYVLGGSAADNLLLLGGSPLPGLTFLNMGAGNDRYVVDASAAGNVLLNDSAGADDRLTVNVPAGQTAAVDFPNNRLDSGGLVLQYDLQIEDVLLSGQGSGAAVAWTGGTGNDTVFLMQDPSDPTNNSQLLSAGRAVRFRNMTSVTVNTLTGADVLQIDNNGPVAGGTTGFVKYVVFANLGGDTSDALVLNDGERTADSALTVTPTSVGAVPGDSLFGTGGYVVYSGLAAGSLNLYTGTGADAHKFVGTGVLPLATNVFSGAGADSFNFAASLSGNVSVSDAAGTDPLTIDGTAAADTVGIANTTITANTNLVVSTAGVDSFVVNGNGGSDTLSNAGTAGADTLTVQMTALLTGNLVGFPLPARFDSVETVSVDGLGGTNNLTWEDRTGTAFGTPVNPTRGVLFAPTGAASGFVRLQGGAGTTTRLANVGGAFTLNGNPAGSPSGQDTRDVVAVLGVSTIGLSSDGEATSTNGRDIITASDAGVSIDNAVLGTLRGVTFGNDPSGNSSFRMVYVKGGNEADGGATGDTVNARTTLRTNLVLDGGTPGTGNSPGDTINVTTSGRAFATNINDPALGPPQTRVYDRGDTGQLGYLNFETVSGNFTPPAGGTGNPFSPVPTRLFAATTDATTSGLGSPTVLRVYNTDGSKRLGDITPFAGFNGGATTAVGDVTGDDFPDIVVAAGAGGGPAVKVYDGATGTLVRNQFNAFVANFKGGVNVAVGYVNADRYADIIVGAGAGGGPNVKVFDGQAFAVSGTLTTLLDYFAFDMGFGGGVRVAAGDVDGDGFADIMSGMQSGGTGVRVHSSAGLTLLADFVPQGMTTNGVNVALGDITGDGRADYIIGAGAGQGTRVVVYGSDNSGLIRDFNVNDPTVSGTAPVPVTSGVRVSAVADLDGDGLAEILTGRGKGSRPFAQYLKVSTRNADGSVSATLSNRLAVNVFGDTYSNGIFVGG